MAMFATPTTITNGNCRFSATNFTTTKYDPIAKNDKLQASLFSTLNILGQSLTAPSARKKLISSSVFFNSRA